MEHLVVEVFHPYRAQEKHQLTIAVGDKLTVVEKDASGWWVGRNARGHVGVFPSTYTKKATTSAPSAEVTRELISARLLAEISDKETTSGASGGNTTASGSRSNVFAIHTDLDYDDVYAMTDSELEREIRKLVGQCERAKRTFAEALERVVDAVVAQRAPSGDPAAAATAQQAVNSRDVELQRLKLGKKRLEELIVLESQLKEEYREWSDTLQSKRLPMPDCLLAPQLLDLVEVETRQLGGGSGHPLTRTATDEPLTSPITPHTTPAPPGPAASNPPLQQSGSDNHNDGNGADDWCRGVTDESLIPYLKRLHQQLLDLNSLLDEQESQMDPLSAELATLEAEVARKQDTLDDLAESHKSLVQQLFDHWEYRVHIAQTEYSELKAGGARGPQLVASLTEQLRMLEKQVEAGKKQYERTEADVVALRATWRKLEEMNALRTQVDRMESETQKWIAEAARYQQEAVQIDKDAKKSMADEQLVYKKLERRRRETYNAIQELKGNLRVYCRIKPCSHGETNECVQPIDDMTVGVTDPDTEQTNEFEFDLVIGEKATQEEIFEEVRPLATSVLDGYNVCIFAYGQTGSGKTYTMEGPPNNRGINYRAVKELFHVARERGDDYRCTMRVSILEVYNDKLFDLQSKRAACKVRWGGEEQGVVIEPIVKQPVGSVDEVQTALERAYLSRSVAGTDCNAHSSRSHCILTVYVDATNSATGQTILAKLHLIDLAGSERVKNSGVEGDRLKEATHINTSLTHLKTVIQGLATKSSFVAYRNSTLTSMLQDSLGGNCKCLMFANISPATHNVPESVCTLKYAAEARKVEIGKVTANIVKKK